MDTAVKTVTFRDFKQAIERRFNELKTHTIFQVKFDKDALWGLYLASFPEGTNLKFRERSEHECSACRAFVKNAGGMVAIVDGKLETIWDVEIGAEYQVVCDVLADFIRNQPIDNVFLHPFSQIGVDNRRGFRESGHYVGAPSRNVASSDACAGNSIGSRLSEYRAMHDVVLRSLQEISVDAIETVQDLIAQNSLYRGAEKKAIVDAFAKLKAKFDERHSAIMAIGEFTCELDHFASSQVIGPNAFVSNSQRRHRHAFG